MVPCTFIAGRCKLTKRPPTGHLESPVQLQQAQAAVAVPLQ